MDRACRGHEYQLNDVEFMLRLKEIMLFYVCVLLEGREAIINVRENSWLVWSFDV